MNRSNFFILAAVTALGIFSTSCSQYAPNTKSGAVIGGLIGAGAGAIIGHQSGRGLEGAAIGTAAGVAGGALIGSARDDRERQYYNNQSRQPYYDQRNYDQRSNRGYPPPPPAPSDGYYQRDQRRPSYY